MGAVYCLGVSPGTEVSGNVIHDINSYSYGGWGLYTDEGATGIVMENNLVYRTKCGGFHQHYGKDNIIKNNIFVDATLYQIQATRPEKHRSFTFTNNIIAFTSGRLYQGAFFSMQSVIDHNLIWRKKKSTSLTSKQTKIFAGRSWREWNKYGYDTHSIIKNPQYTNPKKDDFTPNNKKALRKIGFKPFDFKEVQKRH